MTGRKSKNNGAARPIRTRRDFKGAESALKKLSTEPQLESIAEKRLQSLIHEMEKFDDEDAEDEDPDSGQMGEGPRRRWSDDVSDLE